MKIKAVIFDFDEVVIRAYANHILAFHAIAKKRKLKLKKEEIYKRFGESARTILKDLVPTMKRDEMKEFIKEKDRFYRSYIRKKGVKKIRGIENLLEFLKNNKIKTGIASSATHKNIKTALRITKLTKYFTAIVGADDVKHTKPNPEPLLKAAKLLKTNPKNCIYIGDSIYEMIAARRAHMIGIGITTGVYAAEDLRKNGARYVIKSHSKAENLLKNFL